MDAALTLDGISYHISLDTSGDITFQVMREMEDPVTLSPTAAQLLSEVIQYAVYEAEEKNNA